jgi:hypothetical protein
MKVPFPEDLDNEQFKKLWSRTQWILKNNYLPGIKWEGMTRLQAEPDGEIHD